MKIALAGNQARAMGNFWTPLIRRAISQDHEVVCILPASSASAGQIWEDGLRNLGAKIAHYPLERRGLNPFADLRSLFSLRKILVSEKPDRLLVYTPKSVIYGAMAAGLSGFPPKERRHAMITGLGYAFEADSIGKRLLKQGVRLLYRLALARVGTVWFQNHDDRKLFERLSITAPSSNTRISRGTGVDTDFFRQSPEPEGEAVFLYVGRMLEAKGLRDLATAAGIVKKACPGARVLFLGPEEKGPGAVPMKEILTWQDEGLIEYLGEAHDIRPFLAKSNVAVLPSWREGLPASLLEAMSSGRSLIATDVPGCREVVRHGENGLLVPVKNPEALAGAMLALIGNPGLRRRMAEAGRRICLEDFAAGVVTDNLLRHILQG